MKYSLEYCKANKVAVKCETQEDWDILLIMSGTQTIKSFNSQFPCMGVGLTKGYSHEEYYKSHGAEIITASEFVKSQKWCVKVTKENQSILEKFRGGDLYDHSGYITSDKLSHGETGYWVGGFPKGYHELTFEQFKKYILNENATAMDKKIIGWKVLPKHREYAQKLISPIVGRDGIIDFKEGGEWYDIAKEAGVLDLWFEPVYESSKKTVTLRSKQGEFTVDVEPGKAIKYGSPCDCDYTEIPIDELKTMTHYLPNGTIGKWSIKVNGISIGCKHEIPISDIQKVIDAYEK